MSDWFSENAPSAASGGDWFAANAPPPGPPKAPIPQALSEPFSQQYGLTAAQRADVRSRDTRGLEEVGGAMLMPAAGGAVRAADAGLPVLPAVIQSVKNLGTSMATGTVAALGARKAAKYLGAPEIVADAAALLGGLYGAKTGGSVSEYLSQETGVPSTWKFLKWIKTRPEAAAGEAAAAPEAAAAVPKSPGRLMAEADGRNWSQLGAKTQQDYENIARAQAAYGPSAVKPPIASPSPSPSPAEPSPMVETVPSTTVQPGGKPLRPPLATQGHASPRFEEIGKTTDAYPETLGPGLSVFRVPIEDVEATENPYALGKGPKVQEYAERIQNGEQPPPAYGRVDPETGKVKIGDGNTRFEALKQAGAETVDVATSDPQPFRQRSLKQTEAAMVQLKEQPVVEPPTSHFNAAGEPVSPEMRAAQIVSAKTSAKAQRYAEAVQAFNKQFPEHAFTADELAVANGADRANLTAMLQRAGLLEEKETPPDASFPLILKALKIIEKRQPASSLEDLLRESIRQAQQRKGTPPGVTPIR